jgi:hypothetical protein
MRDEFGKHMELTITRGKVHDYLGIHIDFSKKGKVTMSMFNYIDELLKECPENGFHPLLHLATCTRSIRNAEKLDNETAILYHH